MRKQLIYFLIICASLFLCSCKNQNKLLGEKITENILEVEDDGMTKIDNSKALQATSHVLNGPLSEQEEKDLLYLREEEKLARDINLMLFEHWGIKMLNKVAHSESSHTTAVKQLINKYKLVDPATPDRVAQFTDSDINKLYEKLLKKGKKSEQEALRVSAEMEEISLKSLNDFIDNSNKPDLVFIYESLQTASRNHLRAIAKSLEETGYFYEPEHIGNGAYKDIMNSPIERGDIAE